MKVHEKIKKSLAYYYGTEYANSVVIFKGYYPTTLKYGWHYVPFNSSQAIYLGSNLNDALDTIDFMAEQILS
jgi:hypothetical protein